jgi:DNA helicase-2/ATP-dependent DNA helicase PcrA
MNRLLTDLNEAQREAVTTVSGPLLVIAGAGSGKTRVLTRRLAYVLTERLAEPYQVLAVTFTNKAAGEMKTRISRLLGGDIPDLNVSTFHSFCARLLRTEADALGYDRSFTIFDADDSETLVKNCIKDLGLTGSQFKPKGQLRKISAAKDHLLSPEAFAASARGYFETRTSEIYDLYQRRLRECNAMDFDDLLFNAVRLLQGSKSIGRKYRHRFQYIMVDEYQDTNHVQYLLLKSLIGERNNICVVGDEDQSIYGWRGADIRNILEFEQDFPGAKIIKLEQNYRSTDVILQAASAVIGNNETRKGKTLWTDRQGGEKLRLLLVDSAEEEASHVVDQIDRQQPQTNLKEMVVLYRTNAQSRPFEEQLRRGNIPYQIVGGISFYQRKEIKDLMAYLKLIVNIKDDVSFERIVNYPRRGIGSKTITDIIALARRDGISEYEVPLNADRYSELSSRRKRLEPFVALIEKYRVQVETVAPDLLTQELIDDLNLIEELRSEDQIIGQTRIENIEAFIEGVAEYSRSHVDATLVEYLAEISLFTDIDTYEEADDKVTLMTIHSAKGLEYDTVFMVGLEEGLFPLQRALTEPSELEEERRLFYVGATRTRKNLYLSSATTRYRFGEVMSIPSRFIKEIPEELVEGIDMRTHRSFEQAAVSNRPASLFSHSSTSAGASVQGVHYDFEDGEGLRTGRIVQHPTFGRGKIINTEGYGESLVLEIMFSGLGLKKIMAKYGRLKVIG